MKGKLKIFYEVLNYNVYILKKDPYKEVAIGSFLLSMVFFSFLYGLFKIPLFNVGIIRMNPINFTDVFYIVLPSLILGLLIPLLKYKTHMIPTSSGVSGSSGLFTGIIGTVCPVCQALTVIGFGSSLVLPLGFLVPYANYIRLFSLMLLGISLYVTAYSLYTKTCPYCIISKT